MEVGIGSQGSPSLTVDGDFLSSFISLLLGRSDISKSTRRRQGHLSHICILPHFYVSSVLINLVLLIKPPTFLDVFQRQPPTTTLH